MKVARVHLKAKLVCRSALMIPKQSVTSVLNLVPHSKTSRLLLELAKELNIDVIGVSFHVRSGCTDPEILVQAISDAHCVFDMGAEVGFSVYMLDIGRGFPGCEDVKLKFEEISSVIIRALDKYFLLDSGVRNIAEPGSYYIASAFTLADNLIAKNHVKGTDRLR
uniref:ornithine decarboxylase-like n=1 Tax=Ictidomys tridecemlineatus TaxID=43179 RepID=UPI001A9EAB75|nr:ornithine decarboxylase-like [Ictidomys tridecemlineatus]